MMVTGCQGTDLDRLLSYRLNDPVEPGYQRNPGEDELPQMRGSYPSVPDTAALTNKSPIA